VFYIKIEVFYSLRVKGIPLLYYLVFLVFLNFLNLYILIDLPLLFITLKIILLTYSILNPPTFVKMSLSIIRTPIIRLSLTNIDISPRGTAFMLPIPNAEPELEGR
jgi:hypothetical protein